MSEKLWLFEAIDTLFFRDGTTFRAGETDSRGIRSTFPPSMQTLQGAIRTALALGQGWRKGDSWPEEVLGSFDSLGQLELQGPYLAINRQDKLTYLFPFPASVVKDGESFIFLAPDDSPVATDLMAESRLTRELEAKNLKGTGGLWLTGNGMKSVLAGLQPEKDDWVSSDYLWAEENRIGIALDHNSRTVLQVGGLYSLSHIRPSAQLRIGVVVKGVELTWQNAIPDIIPLGGESRMAIVRTREVEKIIPPAPDLLITSGKLRFTATLITQGHFNNTENGEVESVIRFGPLSNIGNCISACIPKLTQVGGWDIVNRCPRPLRPVLLPGSTWFYEVDATFKDKVLTCHGSHVGSGREYGFGQILIGRWG